MAGSKQHRLGEYTDHHDDYLEDKVINLHVLEACNFRCSHCFAHFGGSKISFKEWKSIVDNVMRGIQVKRFNIAGGEPLLYGDLDELANYIRSKGCEVSIITNGYGLSKQRTDALSECGISMFGLSIDSPNADTLRKVGRHTASGDILTPEMCLETCRHIRERGMALKINTVVSQHNYTEDFSHFIKEAVPSRWKIFKIKEFRKDRFDNSSLLISDAQFDNFVHRHGDIPHIPERTMAGTYIMIDASGNLIDTRSNNNTPVANLLEANFGSVFSKLNFDHDTYNSRYAA